MKKKLSLTRSFLWIGFSILAVNFSVFGGIKGYRLWKKKQGNDYQTPIKTIVQTGPQKEALKTAYLAQLLELSSDREVLTSEFELKSAQQKLSDFPLIKTAEIKIERAGVLYIDYTIRQPIAFLLDFENISLDQEKIPFPFAPFYSPKKLPEIYLGLEDPLKWNTPIQGEKIDLAFDLLKILSAPVVVDLFNILRIDVSNAFKKSYGKREIVLITEDVFYKNDEGHDIRYVFPRILRLNPKKYSQELSNYLKLRDQMIEKEKMHLPIPEDGSLVVCGPQKIIDFRIPKLAFIEEN